MSLPHESLSFWENNDMPLVIFDSARALAPSQQRLCLTTADAFQFNVECGTHARKERDPEKTSHIELGPGHIWDNINVTARSGYEADFDFSCRSTRCRWHGRHGRCGRYLMIQSSLLSKYWQKFTARLPRRT